MADKAISDLTSATSIGDSDLFVLEQSGEAKSITGSMMKSQLKGDKGDKGNDGVSGTKWFTGTTQSELYAAESTANVGDLFLWGSDDFPVVWSGYEYAVLWTSRGDVLQLVSKTPSHYWSKTEVNLHG